MLRHIIPKVDDHLVDIAPAPGIRRIIAFHHRMAGGVEMLGRMAVRGIVAAADMAADPADAQMHPAAARREAFLAAIGARADVGELVEMAASAHEEESCATSR